MSRYEPKLLSEETLAAHRDYVNQSGAVLTTELMAHIDAQAEWLKELTKDRDNWMKYASEMNDVILSFVAFPDAGAEWSFDKEFHCKECLCKWLVEPNGTNGYRVVKCVHSSTCKIVVGRKLIGIDSLYPVEIVGADNE